MQKKFALLCKKKSAPVQTTARRNKKLPRRAPPKSKANGIFAKPLRRGLCGEVLAGKGRFGGGREPSFKRHPSPSETFSYLFHTPRVRSISCLMSHSF